MLKTYLMAATLTVALATHAAAKDGPECFASETQFNICDYARKFQEQRSQMLGQRSQMLPIKKDGDTLTDITAEGPRIVFTYKMKMSLSQFESQFDAQGLAPPGLTRAGMRELVRIFHHSQACRDDAVLLDFMQRGGRLRWLEVTSDGYQVFDTFVDDCIIWQRMLREQMSRER